MRPADTNKPAILKIESQISIRKILRSGFLSVTFMHFKKIPVKSRTYQTIAFPVKRMQLIEIPIKETDLKKCKP